MYLLHTLRRLAARRIPAGMLVVAVVAAMVVSAAIAGTIAKRVAERSHTPTAGPVAAASTAAAPTYQPRGEEERQLLTHLAPATDDQRMAMAEIMRQYGVVAIGGGAFAYIATGDFVLPTEPMIGTLIIGVPQGVRWVGGSLNNIVLVLLNDLLYQSPDMQLSHGYPLYDPLCTQLPITGMIDQGIDTCTADTHRPAQPADMMRQLQKLTPEQVAQYLPGMWPDERAQLSVVYLATQPVRLAPLADAEHTLLLVDTEHGGRIVGGSVGKLRVLTVPPQVRGRTSSDENAVDTGRLQDPLYVLTRVGSGMADWACGYLSPNVQKQYPGVCT